MESGEANNVVILRRRLPETDEAEGSSKLSAGSLEDPSLRASTAHSAQMTDFTLHSQLSTLNFLISTL